MKKVTFERNDIASRVDSSVIVSDGLLADLRQLIDSAKSQVVQLWRHSNVWKYHPFLPYNP
ncbi:MAG: hypothetical protein K8R17_06885, partial [Methanosarcinales archaeon]|nr:hypothetical protein [Methanosarcinales archaeon]